jgi:hypothetical protein
MHENTQDQTRIKIILLFYLPGDNCHLGMVFRALDERIVVIYQSVL